MTPERDRVGEGDGQGYAGLKLKSDLALFLLRNYTHIILERKTKSGDFNHYKWVLVWLQPCFDQVQ